MAANTLVPSLGSQTCSEWGVIWKWMNEQLIEWTHVKAGWVMHQVGRVWTVVAGFPWAKFPRWSYEYQWVNLIDLSFNGKRHRWPCWKEGQSVLTAILVSLLLVWRTGSWKAGKSIPTWLLPYSLSNSGSLKLRWWYLLSALSRIKV